MIKNLLIFLLLSFCFSYQSATEVKEVVWVTPEWKGYTDVDGNGLYNTLIREIFAIADTQVKIEYRSLLMVKDNFADMTGGTQKSTYYHFSAHPIISNKEYVLFRNSVISDWQGLNSLKGKTVVWIEGYLDGADDSIREAIQGFGVSSRSFAYDLFLEEKRGVTYLLNNSDQMTSMLDSLSTSSNKEGLSFEQIYQADLFIIFQQTPRGLHIKNLYDLGFTSLFCAGVIKNIYEQHQLPLPTMKIDCQAQAEIQKSR